MRRVWGGSVREALPFLAAAALWLAPVVAHPTSVVFWRGGAYTDLLISHWPNALLLHRGLFDAGRIPLWNPSILSGSPLAADPLSGMWYLPNWLAVLFPAAISFNILFVLHLTWAGWGAARLAKAEGVSSAGALIAGLIFAGAPKLIGHIGLGHLGLVEAVCWTPWLLVSIGAAFDAPSRGNADWIRRWSSAGAILGLMFLADPRWSVPAAMVGAAYALVGFARSHRGSTGSIPWRRMAGGAALSGAFALGISAVLAVPLWEFVGLSTRAGLSATERTALALPWDHLAGLFIPDYGGWPEWIAYPGIPVILLASLAFARINSKGLFWWAVALVSVVLALGSLLPIYPIAVSLLPGLSLLRVPARFLFLVPLGLSIPAGLGLDLLIGKDDSAHSHKPIVWFGLIAAAIIVAVAALLFNASGGSVLIRARTLTGMALAFLGLAWMVAMLRGTIGSRIGTVGWIFLICADLGLMGFPSLRSIPVAEAIGDPAALATVVAGEASGGRVLSPSYSLPQPASVMAGLELADGIDPLQLASYRDFMASSLGFSPTDYSVTLPPFPDGDPSKAWPVSLDTQQLGLLDVTVIVSAFPLQSNGLSLVTNDQGVYLYRNEDARPRAWVQPSLDSRMDWTPVDQLERSIDDIRVRAMGPGILVIGEIAYPGWRVTVDGRDAPMRTAYGILQSVELPVGEHDVRFVFRPMSVYLGGGLTLLTLVALAWVWKKQ